MKTKTWIGSTLAVALVTMTAACSSSTDGKETATPGASSPAAATASTTPKAPVKISLMLDDSSQPVPTGKSMDDPTIKYLAEKTGTDLSIDFLPHEKYFDTMAMKLASGSTPDVVMGWGILSDLYTNNKLIPLNDLLDKYGPNLKKNIPQSAWDSMKIDGKIYGIPETALGNSTSNRIIFVRKDWMDKVGITEAPKTPDQFLDMLRAFRDKDPNGNNKKDEIPFSARENFSWAENIFSMFGVTLASNHLLNGEVIPGIIHPQMKEALAFLHKMYEEKLIDSEFLSNKRNVWEQKIQSDLVGSWNHAIDLAWDWQDRLNKSLPGKGANVISIPTPIAPGVDHVGIEQVTYKKVFNITNNSKNPEAIIKLFDWLASQDGQEYVNFGVPNLTWTKQGETYTYDKKKDTDNKSITWRSNTFNLISYNKELLTVQLGKEAVDKIDLSYSLARKEGIPNPIDGIPALKSDTNPDLSRYGTMFMQMASRIVLGEKPISYFDEFVKTWRAQGGDAIVKEMTTWYNTNKKK